MSGKLIVVLLIALCALISLIEGFICAREAMKQNDKVLAIGAAVLYFCGMGLLLCLNSITV